MKEPMGGAVPLNVHNSVARQQVISHWYYGHKKALQYLIQWKGYSATDDTWGPADQVFVDALVRAYHRKHLLEGEGA